MAMAFWDALYAFVQFVMVLSVWSYLYKDNIFSRISAQIVISVSVIHYFMSYLKVVYNQGIIPMMPVGWYPLSAGKWWNIIPIILGILLFARLSRKYSWVSSYSYALTLGLGTGATLTTIIQGSIIGLIVNAFSAPFLGTTTLDQASGILLLIGAMTGLTYWLFTREAKGSLGYAIKVGRLFLMASIGLLYAQDVVWSQSLFVGAMQMVLKFIKGVLLGQTV
jgi:hypothetical protein